MQIPYETQYGLDTFEPNMSPTPIVLAPTADKAIKTYFIRCRPTMRWWIGNQYDINLEGRGMVSDPGDPKPTGRVQIAVYRSIIPVPTTYISATPFAEMIPNTLYDTGSTSSIIIASRDTKLDISDLVLGGNFWIVIRIEDTTESGANFMTFSSYGWSIADTSVFSTLLEDITSTGNLPTSYPGNVIRAMSAEYPYLRMDDV